MHVTLTFADVLLTLLLAIMGARGPRWGSRALTWWAERSETSARRRVAKLKLELKLINGFRSEPTRYAGWLVRHLQAILVCLFFFLLAMTGLLLASLGAIEADIMAKLGGSSETGAAAEQLKFPVLLFTAMFVASLVAATAFSERLSRYTNLDRQRALAEEQIARLEKRVQQE